MRFAYAHSSFFSTQVCEDLADFLAARAPGDLNHIYFCVGRFRGCRGGRSSWRRKYFVEVGQPSRRHFIARGKANMAKTLWGALAIGGNEWRRKQFFARCWCRRIMFRPAIPTVTSVMAKPTEQLCASAG